VHFAASTPNFLILEYRIDSEGANRGLIREPLTYRDGYVEIPETPGLGIELNEKAFAGNPLKTWHRAFMYEADGNVWFQ
jgi:L-alanine-DL-glutamate epimerase-like enolase superfamily enzyme